MPEPNDRRQGRIHVNYLSVVLDLLRFTLEKKHDCAPPCTYVKRLV